MTEPADYVTEGEIVKRMRVGINSGRKALQEMRKHPKFPPKTIGGKRYWPSVRDFLDLWNHRTLTAPGIGAGQEKHHGQTTSSGRARPSLAAAEQWLGSRVGSSAGLRQGGVSARDVSNRGVHRRPDRG